MERKKRKENCLSGEWKKVKAVKKKKFTEKLSEL